MTQLSVNVNKIATLRNSRGGQMPDVIKVAQDIERYGAAGITVHPRPDERHIRYSDVRTLKKKLRTELNIEGNPREQKFVDLVLDTRPHQVTLVPDAAGQLTSNHGWDTHKDCDYLREMIGVFKEAGIRTSIFVNADVNMVEGAAKTGTDRIELYTESYAKKYWMNRDLAIAPFIEAAKTANKLNLGINAGHDLNLDNLKFFAESIPHLLEVSIGHALICDALYHGLNQTVMLYRLELDQGARTNSPVTRESIT
ncbi:MAG: pyridoxine 5'-phosphate synthase [Bacteroidia bacterium]